MGLIRHYLRVFFRTNFRPIPQHTAKLWEINTTIIYFLLAWTTFGASIYYFKKNIKEDSPYAAGYAFTPYDAMKKFGLEQGSTLIRVEGLTVEKEVLSYEEIEKKIKEANKASS